MSQPEPMPSSKFLERYSYEVIQVGSKTGEALMAFDELEGIFVVIKRPGLRNPVEFQLSLMDLRNEKRALETPGIAEHPAVCKLLDSGETTEGGSAEPYLYLVIERACGVSVPDLIQEY